MLEKGTEEWKDARVAMEKRQKKPTPQKVKRKKKTGSGHRRPYSMALRGPQEVWRSSSPQTEWF